MSQIFPKKDVRDNIILLILLVLYALLMHLMFSWAGFNPTDDGLILATSRRILDGQIPHKDFISVRPIGSALIYLPIVAFGGDYTFWLSRLCFFLEFAFISWTWVSIFKYYLKVNLSILESFLWGILIFNFSSHNFPPMASPTVDGLFFISYGFFVYFTSKKKVMKFVSYLLIGLAYLFKQNFLIIGPLTIMIFNDYRYIFSFIAFLLPAIFYLLFLLLNAALVDFISQISSRYDLINLIEAGIIRYIFNRVFYFGIIIGILIRLLFYIKKRNSFIKITPFTLRVTGNILLFGILFYIANFLSKNDFLKRSNFIYILYPSFFLFSFVVGIVVFSLIMERIKDRKIIILGLITLSLVWTVSISIGYKSPALASGLLVLFLLSYQKYITSQGYNNKILKLLTVFSLILITIFSLVNYYLGRANYIYREKPIKFLNRSVDQIIPGTKFIKTNDNTYIFLLDLQKAINKAKIQNKEYIILPELAAYWVKSKNKNPFPIDWASPVEIGNKKNLNRVLKVLDNVKGEKLILLQKISAASLPVGFNLIAESRKNDEILKYVKANFKKVDETEFFEIY